MATTAPDPRTFTSWEDAFQYPVATIRKFEQQLRTSGNDNKEKLRSLVGASYRELLGTAERIIEMDEMMHEVDGTLSHVGRRCNKGALDKSAVGFSGLKKWERRQNANRFAQAAQLTILQSCPGVISRLLKRDGSSLLAAKILVISRLLHKTLSDISSSEPALEKLRIQLGSLRRALLSHIDRQFSRLETENATLLENMVAFSMATSSTPTDVLRHFHHIRSEAIVNLLDTPIDAKGNIVKGIRLYVRTLHDTQAIFPKRLSEALARLRDCPLLQDRDVQGVQELKLDVHERWIADEVRQYTPWPRQDDLKKPEAEKILKAWAKQALKAYLSSLKPVLEGQEGLDDVVIMRKELLETWNASNVKIPGLRVADVLDDLRDVFNDVLRKLVDEKASALDTVSDQTAEVLKDWKAGRADASISLWAADTTSVAISEGGVLFKQTILDRSNGRNDSVSAVILAYERWAQSIFEIYINIKVMKETRWDDDFSDVEEDDDDDTASITLESKQVLLSEDDPRELEATLREALERKVKDLAARLEGLIRNLPATSAQDLSDRSCFLLRIIRELDTRTARLSLKSAVSISSLSAPLHQNVAAYVKTVACTSFGESLARLQRSHTVAARALWEGNPPLPVQPSPGTFRFLKTLTTSMAEAGAELWTREAAAVLKRTCEMELTDLTTSFVKKFGDEADAGIKQQVNGNRGKDEDGEKEGDESEMQSEGSNGENEETTNDDASKVKDSLNEQKSLHQGKLTQLLFDILYLQRALSSNAVSNQQSFESLLEPLKTQATLDSIALDRLTKSALEYWKRTYLLFALLA